MLIGAFYFMLRLVTDMLVFGSSRQGTGCQAVPQVEGQH